MIADDFAALRQAARASGIGRGLRWPLGTAAAAWQHSVLRARLSSLTEYWQRQRDAERLQSVLLFVGSALISYAMLLSLIPRYVATAVPAAWFYAGGALFLIAAAVPSPLAAALTHSRLARVWRALLR